MSSGARAVCLVVASVVVVATLVLARHSSGGAATTPRQATATTAVAAGVLAGRPAQGSPVGERPTRERPAPRPPVQQNAEQADPALRREHERLLAQRPVFQHLPYRDHAIGVGFDRVLPSGALELLVTYVGSRARAVADMHRLLARYGDPGTAYVERYERVF